MNQDNNFAFQPPEYEQNGQMIPASRHEAWILQLIQTRFERLDVDDDFKKQFLQEVAIIINGASMTQVRRGEVNLFLGEWEELWMKFRIFKCKRKHYRVLNYMKTFVENKLLQAYNCSIDGWQGDHVFEQKTSYDVKQTTHDLSQPNVSWRQKRKMDKKMKKEGMYNEVIQQ